MRIPSIRLTTNFIGLGSFLMAGLLTGCVHVGYEPSLPMPERPEVRFFRQSGNVCISESDARLLLKYTQKLDEFERDRAELLK